MAIIKCNECGADISSKAIACPKCGIELQKKNKKKIFSKLADFSYARNAKEAFGFYMTYFIVSIVVVFMISSIYALVSKGNFAAGMGIGKAMAILISIQLSVAIALAKKIIKKPEAVAGIILSLLLSTFLGLLGGLIPAAYLTTLAKEK